jgi:hypothetical protein
VSGARSTTRLLVLGSEANKSLARDDVGSFVLLLWRS